MSWCQPPPPCLVLMRFQALQRNGRKKTWEFSPKSLARWWFQICFNPRSHFLYKIRGLQIITQVVKLQMFFIFIPKIGEDEPILMSIQRGWFNHQLVGIFRDLRKKILKPRIPVVNVDFESMNIDDTCPNLPRGKSLPALFRRNRICLRILTPLPLEGPRILRDIHHQHA